MKYCRILPLLFLATILGIQALAQQQPVSTPLPTSGRVEGAVYQNTFFGLKYFVPEQWTARSSAAKLPGVTNGYFLMQARRKAGDLLSSLTITAVELAAYGGKVEKFVDERYRPKVEGTESETTINGVRWNRSKATELEPELLMIGDRSFYRISTESPGVTRLSIVTSEKGYALVFELIVPAKYSDDLGPAFMDSLHSLEFNTAPAATATK